MTSYGLSYFPESNPKRSLRKAGKSTNEKTILPLFRRNWHGGYHVGYEFSGPPFAKGHDYHHRDHE